MKVKGGDKESSKVMVEVGFIVQLLFGEIKVKNVIFVEEEEIFLKVKKLKKLIFVEMKVYLDVFMVFIMQLELLFFVLGGLLDDVIELLLIIGSKKMI